MLVSFLELVDEPPKEKTFGTISLDKNVFDNFFSGLP